MRVNFILRFHSYMILHRRINISYLLFYSVLDAELKGDFRAVKGDYVKPKGDFPLYLLNDTTSTTVILLILLLRILSLYTVYSLTTYYTFAILLPFHSLFILI